MLFPLLGLVPVELVLAAVPLLGLVPVVPFPLLLPLPGGPFPPAPVGGPGLLPVLVEEGALGPVDGGELGGVDGDVLGLVDGGVLGGVDGDALGGPVLGEMEGDAEGVHRAVGGQKIWSQGRGSGACQIGSGFKYTCAVYGPQPGSHSTWLLEASTRTNSQTSPTWVGWVPWMNQMPLAMSSWGVRGPANSPEVIETLLTCTRPEGRGKFFTGMCSAWLTCSMICFQIGPAAVAP